MLNDNQLKAKRYLEQIKKYSDKIEADRTALYELRMMSTTIKSVDNESERVQTSARQEANFVNIVNKIVDSEKEIADNICELLELRFNIRKMINKLEDLRQVLLLCYRYIEFQHWNIICEKLDVSMRTVHRIHENALTNFAVIIEQSKGG